MHVYEIPKSLSYAAKQGTAQDRDIEQLRTSRFLMGRNRDSIPEADLVALDTAMGEVREVPPRTILVRKGERVRHSTYLIEGHVCRYMDDREGQRQLVGTHVPGDFFDLHSFPMHHLDHYIATLGPVKIGVYPHETLARLTEASPTLTRALWFSTLLDAAMHREWIFRLGRLDADGRVAHFFCEMGVRLAMVGLCDGKTFALPINQTDLAEACGITPVHANRTLRSLREQGLMTFRSGIVTILDRGKLSRLAEFDIQYLYGTGDFGS